MGRGWGWQCQNWLYVLIPLNCTLTTQGSEALQDSWGSNCPPALSQVCPTCSSSLSSTLPDSQLPLLRGFCGKYAKVKYIHVGQPNLRQCICDVHVRLPFGNQYDATIRAFVLEPNIMLAFVLEVKIMLVFASLSCVSTCILAFFCPCVGPLA